MQTVIVIVIVAAAAFFIGRRFYKSVKRGRTASTCGCGCSGCEPARKQDCSDIEGRIT